VKNMRKSRKVSHFDFFLLEKRVEVLERKIAKLEKGEKV